LIKTLKDSILVGKIEHHKKCHQTSSYTKQNEHVGVTVPYNASRYTLKHAERHVHALIDHNED